tara:strand:+ start:2799 stop:3461 length:663 start_codon:yes stop_codon:yes gene_type:complete
MIHAIILARGGSKTIKNKNLKIINGKPLVYWSIKHSLNSKKISKTWVSSDNLKILNYSKKIGAQIILRPKKISGDKASSESAWIHAISEIKKDFKITSILGIQPTSPIRDSLDFDRAIKKYYKFKYDSLFSANYINDYNSWKIKGSKLIANYNFKKRSRRQDIKNLLLENGSFYIFNSKKFLKNKNRLFGKIGFFIMPKRKSFQIDDYLDIKIIEKLFNI